MELSELSLLYHIASVQYFSFESTLQLQQLFKVTRAITNINPCPLQFPIYHPQIQSSYTPEASMHHSFSKPSFTSLLESWSKTTACGTNGYYRRLQYISKAILDLSVFIWRWFNKHVGYFQEFYLSYKEEIFSIP